MKSQQIRNDEKSDEQLAVFGLRKRHKKDNNSSRVLPNDHYPSPSSIIETEAELASEVTSPPRTTRASSKSRINSSYSSVSSPLLSRSFATPCATSSPYATPSGPLGPKDEETPTCSKYLLDQSLSLLKSPNPVTPTLTGEEPLKFYTCHQNQNDAKEIIAFREGLQSMREKAKILNFDVGLEKYDGLNLQSQEYQDSHVFKTYDNADVSNENVDVPIAEAQVSNLLRNFVFTLLIILACVLTCYLCAPIVFPEDNRMFMNVAFKGQIYSHTGVKCQTYSNWPFYTFLPQAKFNPENILNYKDSLTWCFKGDNGNVIIKLRYPSKIKQILVTAPADYKACKVSGRYMSNAPKEMALKGYQDTHFYNIGKYEIIGEFVYKFKGGETDHKQNFVFDMSKQNEYFKYIELDINSNHGLKHTKISGLHPIGVIMREDHHDFSNK